MLIGERDKTVEIIKTEDGAREQQSPKSFIAQLCLTSYQIYGSKAVQTHVQVSLIILTAPQYYLVIILDLTTLEEGLGKTVNVLYNTNSLIGMTLLIDTNFVNKTQLRNF